MFDDESIHEAARELESLLPFFAYAIGIVGAVALAYWIMR